MRNSYEKTFRQNAKQKAEERERLRAKVRSLREEGLTFTLIAQRLGCSATHAKYLHDAGPWMAPRS